MPGSIFKYFDSLTYMQKDKILHLKDIYDRWNTLINVISRKDMDNFYLHHVLHSMSLAKVISFVPGTKILDVGTGGGFPGIPLSILFPDSHFSLLDSTGKKIKVVTAVSEELELKNVTPLCKRAENEKGIYDFVVCRAVTGFPAFVKLTRKNIDKTGNNSLRNGILYLKGGDLAEELTCFREKVKVWNIKDIFDEPYYETKRIVYLPV